MNELPSEKDIDELTAYLPRLYAEGFKPVKSWNGGTTEEGDLIIPTPVYIDVVQAFFEIARQRCWCDYAYTPEVARNMLADVECVKSANLTQIKTMLTFCVRGERFCDGFWASMIESGAIRQLLERLVIIRSVTV